MDSVFLVIGCFGFLGMMGFGSLLMWPILLMARSRDQSTLVSLGPLSGDSIGELSRIEILIPVHNEEDHLTETLRSIEAAVDEIQSSGSKIQVRVRIGLDASTDGSLPIAMNSSCEIQEFQFKSKWRTLIALLQESQCDWVILADAGVTWPKKFLIHSIPFLEREDLVGVAPAYRMAQTPGLQSIHWFIERCLKNWESKFLGGPVSVHGATVFYRFDALKRVIEALNEKVGPVAWSVDDVVVPLVLRSLHPSYRIEYWEGSSPQDRLIDEGTRKDSNSPLRRKRMVLGNLQWIRLILPWVMGMNPIVAVIASRRVFRLFWGYWILVMIVGLAFFPGTYGISLVVLCGLFLNRELYESWVCSLMIPIYLAISEDRKTIRWG